MWNILIVIIIVIIVSFFNSKYNFIELPSAQSIKQNIEVNNVVNEAINTADEARRLQKEQLDEINN